MRGSVPLMLGVWGKKGCGKSFNVELCCLEMGITPVVVSAGELEVQNHRSLAQITCPLFMLLPCYVISPLQPF